MAKKKNNPAKAAQKKTIIVKIAGKVGQLAGELAAGKDHFIEIAGDAIESVKSTIKNIAAKENAAPKNVNAMPKKPVKKQISGAIKKSANAVAVKKVAAPKKSVKKVIKKVAKKIAAKK